MVDISGVKFLVQTKIDGKVICFGKGGAGTWVGRTPDAWPLLWTFNQDEIHSERRSQLKIGVEVVEVGGDS